MVEKSVWRDGDGVERQAVREMKPRSARSSVSVAGAIWLVGLHWYVVRVKPRTEMSVVADLERRGFVAVLPMLRQWRRASRFAKRKLEVSTPLLPGYVLIGFDPANGPMPWGLVFELTMVVAVIGEFGIPQRVRGSVVVAFLAEIGELREPAAQQRQRSGEPFGVGDMVRVAEGSLFGFTARVHAIDGEAARILLPLFGKAEQELSLPLANLERAD